MNRELHIIIIIHVTDRIKNAGELQKTLSDFGCYIRTRIGLHETNENYCSSNGVIVLEFVNNDAKADELIESIEKLEGVEIKKVVFDHDAQNMS